MGLGDFRHEDDDRVRRLRSEFGGMGVLESAHVPSPFDDGDLEPEADTEEGHLFLSGPLDGGDHTLGPSMSEPTGDDDPLGATDGPPGVVVLDRVRGLGLGLEVGRVDPLEVELFAAAHGSVFERLDDGHVRVLEGDVFADEDDGDGLVATFGAGSDKDIARSARSFLHRSSPTVPSNSLERHLLPPLQQILPFSPLLLPDLDLIQLQTLGQEVYQPLVPHQQGDVVSRVDVVHAKHLRGLDVAEHGDFFHCCGEELVFASTGDLQEGRGWAWQVFSKPFQRELWTRPTRPGLRTHDIRQQPQPPQIPHPSLRRLRLLFPSNNGDQRNVHKGEVFYADAELELTHGFDKGGGFDIPDCAA
jgi:hypothetical protein